MAVPTVLPAALAPPPAIHPLTRDMLVWLAARPRTYAETMEVWRTSCPRFSIWEDALAAGLVRVDPVPGAPLTDSAVCLTPQGQELLP
jgi:hypothetical protein